MNRLHKEIYYNSWFVLPLLLLSIFNFGNYTFLAYTIDGYHQSSFFNGLKYFRIVFVIYPVIILFSNKDYIKKLYYFLFKNYDILFLIIILVYRFIFDSDKVYPIWFLFSILSLFILFMILRLLSIDTTDYTKKVVIFLFLSAAIVIPFTFLSIPKLFDSNDIYFSSKNAYAYYNLILIVSVLSYLIISNKKLNIYYIIFIGLNILVLLLSGRRTPFITSILSLFIFFIFYSKSIKTYILTSILVSIYLLNLVYFSEKFLSIQRLENIDFEDETYDSSYEARLELRTYYFELIEDSNYLGLGFLKSKEGSEKQLSTHNTYLTTFLIIGFFGLVTYLFIILRSIYFVLKSNNRGIIIVYAILFLPIFTINWVETNFLPGQIFFVYTISVMLSPRFIIDL